MARRRAEMRGAWEFCGQEVDFFCRSRPPTFRDPIQFGLHWAYRRDQARFRPARYTWRRHDFGRAGVNQVWLGGPGGHGFSIGHHFEWWRIESYGYPGKHHSGWSHDYGHFAASND